TTGAGDHFNSGFCLGKLLGFSTEQCLQTGVTTSGFYVRTGQSPVIADLAGMLRNWPSLSTMRGRCLSLTEFLKKRSRRREEAVCPAKLEHIPPPYVGGYDAGGVFRRVLSQPTKA